MRLQTEKEAALNNNWKTFLEARPLTNSSDKKKSLQWQPIATIFGSLKGTHSALDPAIRVKYTTQTGKSDGPNTYVGEGLIRGRILHTRPFKKDDCLLLIYKRILL